jgi:hypothetical protein
MSTRKTAPRKPPKRAPRPNNPFGIDNDEWDRLCFEQHQYEGKVIAWSPGHDKILAAADDYPALRAELERLGLTHPDNIFAYVETQRQNLGHSVLPHVDAE